MPIKIPDLLLILFVCCSCSQPPKSADRVQGKEGDIRIIQLDPTHSHAAAAQSDQIDRIDSNVYVYAPVQEDVTPYFQQINAFNTRKINPTRWHEISYFGKDYLEKMAADKKGNVVVLAGNNRIKIDYIEQSVNAGMNVFSDKPMVINRAGFQRLENVYQLAQNKGLLMFDMMTERYSLINRVQRSLMQDTLLFGKLLPGTADHPSVMESSVHHFYRGGKGTRPAWYFDVLEQGEGIVDVTTHLIDLTFWKMFPDKVLDYQKDIKVLTANRSSVGLTGAEFSAATSLPSIPSSLAQYTKDSTLEVYANGSITYLLNGAYTQVKVEWRPATPPDGNDLRNGYAEGSRSTLLIQQVYGQKRPKLCIQKNSKISEEQFRSQLKITISLLQSEYPGISFTEESKMFQIVIPSELENANDPTFKVFVGYLIHKDLPKWEVPNTLAKYYITTTALEMAKRKK